MNVDEFYRQEHEIKPHDKSCFANTEGIEYFRGQIENEDIFSKDDLKAFAEAYHRDKLKESGSPYTDEQLKQMVDKAEKWDILGEKIAKCYGDHDEDGNESPSQHEIETGSKPDLITIGEMAASAYGWI